MTHPDERDKHIDNDNTDSGFDLTHITFFLAGWCNIFGKTAAGLQWHGIIRLGEVFADEVAVGGSDKDGWGLLVFLIERLVLILIEGLVGLP